MGFMDKIEKIRNQPEDVRKRYVFVWVAISMCCVIVIWFVTLRGNQSPPTDEEKIRQDQLYQEIGGQKKSMEDSLKEAGDAYKNFQQIQDNAQNQLNQPPQEGAVDNLNQGFQPISELGSGNPATSGLNDNSTQ